MNNTTNNTSTITWPTSSTNQIFSPTITLADSAIRSNPMEIDRGGKISINGKDADILINDVSLMDTLNGISERLNLLSINPELESDWEELRLLGEQYRKLESEIIEKQKFWNTLKNKKS